MLHFNFDKETFPQERKKIRNAFQLFDRDSKGVVVKEEIGKSTEYASTDNTYAIHTCNTYTRNMHIKSQVFIYYQFHLSLRCRTGVYSQKSLSLVDQYEGLHV